MSLANSTNSANSSSKLQPYLQLFLGPMFSGKTTRLNEELTLLADNGFKVLRINYKQDMQRRSLTKSADDFTTTHNSSFVYLSKKIIQVLADKLSEVDIDDYDAIGIDESNFYPDLVEKVTEWSKIKYVLCSGLDGSFKQTQFGRILELIPIADDYIKIKACCDVCKKESNRFPQNQIRNAPFTKKITNDEKISDIGGKDKYYAVCRKHLNN